MQTKSGYVTIVGLPNAGKSTLLNSILGEKLSITTNKPQTTRRKVLGILNGENYQIIFIDTPGILEPEYKLQELMLNYVFEASNETDILLFILDVENDPLGEKFFSNEVLKKILNRKNSSKILAVNKIDLSNQESLKISMIKFGETKFFDRIIPLSALHKFNIQELISLIIEYLPEHPKFFPEDMLTDQNERFFVSEIIREKVFEQFREEIPYSTTVVIDEFKEREGRKDFIQASIIVEKDSQKPIILGKGGEQIKKLGKNSREAIEDFLQRPVYLELFVKVKSKWRSNIDQLKNLGYETSDE